MINLERIKAHRLETDPYRWTAITDLYTPEDAEKLAATYPCDHFSNSYALNRFLVLLVSIQV